MAKVQIIINEKSIVADSGKTILQICREHNIDIPTLCYDDQLGPFTSCYLCVVKIEGSHSLVPACATRINQGMKIITYDSEIYEARKMALELLLSNHYADCLGPCKLSCPAGVDVQGYLALASMGKYKEAIELIKKNNPLPTVCGRVCTRPCEMNCRRNFVDEAAAIDHVKRFIADIDLDSPERYFPKIKEDTGYKIAIIGAGPAGLSCAFYLRQEGHTVDIFDAKVKAGGMLRWGIPQYRLPEGILDKEIEGITKLGIHIYLNKALGRDFTIDDLFKKGYKSIFLGLGAQSSTSMNIENEDANGVLSGIDFLEDIKLNKIKSLSGKVGVIGGGNTAMDAARSALRLGAGLVNIVYRRTQKEMPANQAEIEEAKEEGINFIFLTAPVKVVLDKNKQVKGIECIKMELGPPDSSGRRRPVPVERSNYVMDLDWVISAIGQKPDLGFVVNDNKMVNIRQTKWGTLEIRPDIMDTNIPGVFAGGDVVLGPATAIEAIADGRKAAEAINRYISGKKLDLPKKPFVSRRDEFKMVSENDFTNIIKVAREKMAGRNPEERIKNWQEIELGFTPDQVFHESLRCLECGCQVFFDCDLQKYSTEYEAIQKNYIGEYQDSRLDKSHPYIEIELNKCILCGRCIRICDEVMGLGVFGFVNRGFKTNVKPLLELPLAETHCISCGQCVDTCPTGALIDIVDAIKPGPWILKSYSTICQYCSVGCNMKAHVLEDRVIKISSDKSAVVNEYGNLCVKGRYGFRYVNDEERIIKPYVKKNGRLEPVSWEDAIDFTVSKIREINRKNVEWVVFGSPYMSNEEIYLLQKFSRLVLRTNNISSFSFLNNYPEELLRISMSSSTFDNIKTSDFIWIYNLDPIKTHPVLYIKIYNAIRSGKNVYITGNPDSQLAKKAVLHNVVGDKLILYLKYIIDLIHKRELINKSLYKYHQEELEEIIKNVSNISIRFPLSEFFSTKKEFDKFFNNLLKSKNPIFVYDRKMATPEFIYWINCLSIILGKTDSILSIPTSINDQGMINLGLLSNLLPGYQRFDNLNILKNFNKTWQSTIPSQMGRYGCDSYNAINSGQINGMIFWKQDPVGTSDLAIKRDPNSFMITVDFFMTKTAEISDVVFPLVPFFETSGTITNAENRVLNFKKVLETRSGMENWEIIAKLGNVFNTSFKYASVKDIYNEILKVVPEYKKEVVLFKNDGLPSISILKGIHSKIVPNGGNYIEKWFFEQEERYKNQSKRISDKVHKHQV